MSARQLHARLNRFTPPATAVIGQDRDRDRRRCEELRNRKLSPAGQTRAPHKDEVKRDLEASTPAMTSGHTMSDMRAVVEAIIGEGEIARMLAEPVDKLLADGEKLNLVTLLIVEKIAHLQAIQPKDAGTFCRAAAQTFLATAEAIRARQAIPPQGTKPGDEAKLIEHDTLDPAWAAMRKAAQAAA